MNRPVFLSPSLRALAALAILLLAPVLGPFLAPAPGGDLVAQARVSEVHGAEIRVLQQSGIQLRGELLAVAGDRLWLLGADQVVQAPLLPDIRRVDMDRHGFGWKRIMTWTALAGGVTGAAMLGACSTVEDGGNCARFTLAWVAAWAGVGALSGLVAQPTRRVGPGALEELRPWARFPQGLPADFTPVPGGVR